MKTYFLILSLTLSIAGNIHLSIKYANKSKDLKYMQSYFIIMQSRVHTMDSILKDIDNQWLLIKQIESNYIREMDSITNKDYVLKTYFSGTSVGGGW